MQATAVAGPVRSLGEAVRASLTGALGTLLSALPRIIAFGARKSVV